MESKCLQLRSIIAEFATILFLDRKFLLKEFYFLQPREKKKYNDVLKARVYTCGFPSLVMNGFGLVLPRHTNKCHFALGGERGKCSFPGSSEAYFSVLNKFEMRAKL